MYRDTVTNCGPSVVIYNLSAFLYLFIVGQFLRATLTGFYLGARISVTAKKNPVKSVSVVRNRLRSVCM